jgi:hypothetical protein
MIQEKKAKMYVNFGKGGDITWITNYAAQSFGIAEVRGHQLERDREGEMFCLTTLSVAEIKWRRWCWNGTERD